MRRYRFSLMTLMSLVTILAICLSWVGIKLQKYRTELLLARSMQRIGITVEEMEPAPRWVQILLANTEVGTIRAVDSSGATFNNEALSLLLQATHIETLLLNDANLSNDDIVCLSAMPNLTTLYLAGTLVDDAVARELTRFEQLRVIDLRGTRVTDDGICVIAAMPRLNVLAIDHTAVTDGGLDCLAQSASLRVLYAWKTAVTDAGIADLKKARPSLQVVAAPEDPVWFPQDWRETWD